MSPASLTLNSLLVSIPPLVPQCPGGKIQTPTGKAFHHQAPAALLALIPLSLFIPVILSLPSLQNFAHLEYPLCSLRPGSPKHPSWQSSKIL